MTAAAGPLAKKSRLDDIHPSFTDEVITPHSDNLDRLYQIILGSEGSLSSLGPDYLNPNSELNGLKNKVESISPWQLLYIINTDARVKAKLLQVKKTQWQVMAESSGSWAFGSLVNRAVASVVNIPNPWVETVKKFDEGIRAEKEEHEQEKAFFVKDIYAVANIHLSNGDHDKLLEFYINR